MRSLYLFVLLFSLVAVQSPKSRARVGPTSCHKQLLVLNNGTINGPAELGNNLFCNYALEADPANHIKLKFTETDLGSPNYLLDYVLVFDGADCLSPRIGVAHEVTTPVFVSSGYKMAAVFIRYGSQINFTAEYAAVPKYQNATLPGTLSPDNQILRNCGDEFSGTRGNLSFKGDGKYNALCIWRLSVNQGKQVHLNVTNVQLEVFDSWIRVLDGGNCAAPQLAFITRRGISLPYTVNSTSNVMIVIFASGSGSPTEIIEASFSDGDLAVLMPRSSTGVNLPTNRLTEIPEYANSRATKYLFNMMASILVHSAYYAYCITTP